MGSENLKKVRDGLLKLTTHAINLEKEIEKLTEENKELKSKVQKLYTGNEILLYLEWQNLTAKIEGIEGLANSILDGTLENFVNLNRPKWEEKERLLNLLKPFYTVDNQ